MLLVKERCVFAVCTEKKLAGTKRKRKMLVVWGERRHDQSVAHTMYSRGEIASIKDITIVRVGRVGQDSLHTSARSLQRWLLDSSIVCF